MKLCSPVSISPPLAWRAPPNALFKSKEPLIEVSARMEFITSVDPAEFESLAPLTIPTLVAQMETVRAEVSEFEEWLGNPPADASEDNIQDQLSVWDQARQWFFAYEAEIFAKRQEIASLDEELAEVRGLLRDLESDSHDGGGTRGHLQMSHDEMAAAEAYWDELDRRENRILARLDALGAPLPSDAPAPSCGAPDTRSWIQRQLDEEWESANHSGPGCPFCDSLFGACSCWARRREAHEAEERRRVREERATIARAIEEGKCYCHQLSQDYPEQCEICLKEEELRCHECGDLQCRPDCCGGCGGCERCRGPECKRCGDWDCSCYDDESSCGCGACEEHDWRAEEGAW